MNDQEIVEMYVERKMSTHAIAEQLNTYPNKIRRTLIKYGIPLNDKSVAQQQAIETGRAKHPTKGKKRSPVIRQRISEKIYQNWKNLSSEEYQKRVDQSRTQWYNMTEQERELLRKSAAEAVRQAAKDGSKMEKFLMVELNKKGYEVIFHKTGLIPNNNLEIDMFIPSINCAIEIDGPAHFFPIWGETEKQRQENLQRQINADTHKTGLILSHDFVMISIKHLSKNVSEKNKRDLLNKVLVELKKIEKKFPPKGKRFIELEI